MNKNKGQIIAFLIFLGIIVVGGYILMRQSFKNKNDGSTNRIISKRVKIDDSKDYIYFSDSNTIVGDLDIEYRKINFNFKDYDSIVEKINNKEKEMKEGIKYDDTLEDDSYDKLSYAMYAKYEVLSYDNYVTLVSKYYEYSVGPIIKFLSSDAYVFDMLDVKLVSKSELLEKYNITKDDIDKKIRSYVEGENLLSEDAQINLEDTLLYNSDATIYVDKLGRLCASIIVKNNNIDYNEVIVLS